MANKPGEWREYRKIVADLQAVKNAAGIQRKNTVTEKYRMFSLNINN
jgi:hypothetical protein